MAGGITVTPLDQERIEEFTAIFGGPTVPVTSVQPEELVNAEWKTAMVFYLDLNAITQEQRGRLVAHLAQKHNLTADWIEYSLNLTGFFIVAQNIIIDFQP
jgi:hypothetical protein